MKCNHKKTMKRRACFLHDYAKRIRSSSSSSASVVAQLVMNGWWSNTYYDHVVWEDGLNELQITETMANECAKGGEGRDLDLMLYGGTMTLNAVFYEE